MLAAPARERKGILTCTDCYLTQKLRHGSKPCRFRGESEVWRLSVGYKTKVSTIVKKTYHYHGIANGSWGRDEDDELCSYSAGCAIGLSLSPRTAERLDLDGEALGGGLGVNSALEYPEVREDLFGSAEKPPEWVGQALREVQTAHDATATNGQAVSEWEARASYRRGIAFIVKQYGLEPVRKKYGIIR